jgi:hypothetical protein
MARDLRLDGRGHCKCSRGCGYWSLAGLAQGWRLCPFHWAEHQWGSDWARRCFPLWTPRAHVTELTSEQS